MSIDTLFQVGNEVKRVLAEPELKFYREQMEQHIKQNNELHRLPSTYGIIHGGRMYYSANHRHSAASSRLVKPAHISLLPEFEGTIKQRNDVDREIQMIWQAMVPMFQYHRGIEHRDAVPDELAMHIAGLAKTPRKISFEDVLGMAPTGARERFQAIQPRMQHYLALRMAI